MTLMPADLQKVQGAVTRAQEDFRNAINESVKIPTSCLTDYLNRFLDPNIQRPYKIRKCAESALKSFPEFDKKFISVTENVALAAAESHQLVMGATLAAQRLILKKFLKQEEKVAVQNKIEQLKSDAANLGYAGALLEQLVANLVDDRIKSLNEFSEHYLKYKTAHQVLREISSQDVVNILFDVLVAAVPGLALLGPIRVALETWDKKRRPIAGVLPGNTDIMFELDELLEIDTKRIGHIWSALTGPKEYGKVLKNRTREIEQALDRP